MHANATQHAHVTLHAHATLHAHETLNAHASLITLQPQKKIKATFALYEVKWVFSNEFFVM